MRKTALFIGLGCCIFYLGCSGRTPNPIPAYMSGDAKLSCEEIKIEMARMKTEIALKPAKIQERKARNWGLLCFGFLIYPLFEIDTLHAEETEMRALNTRYNSLFMIAVGRQCPLANEVMTLKTPGGRELTPDDILENKLPSATARFLDQ